jgi:hypothetical protein
VFTAFGSEGTATPAVELVYYGSQILHYIKSNVADLLLCGALWRLSEIVGLKPQFPTPELLSN